MGYPLRPLVPDSVYFVTLNCSERRCLLRPDPEINELIAYWLARASCRHPRILIYGVVIMSNHLHLLVRDRASELPDFMAYFSGNLAKGINAIRDRQGHVFDRRFASERVLDDEAFVGRLVYLVTNPAKASLVDKHEQWPGLLFWARDGITQERPVRYFDRIRYERDCRRAGRSCKQPDRAAYILEETLFVHPIEPVADCEPPKSRDVESQRMLEAVRARETELAQERSKDGRKVLGARNVQRQDWRQAPGPAKRSPRPLCHAASATLREAFREAWWALRRAYADASEAFRAGSFDVEFPAFTFRPGGGLWSPEARLAAA